MFTTYFQHPFCSNSTLSAFAVEIGLKAPISADVQEAYRIGSLFDAVVTEPTLLDIIQMRILGTDYSFTKAEYLNCQKMAKALSASPLYKAMLACKPEFQKELYVPDMLFEHEGCSFTLNMRGKLDYFMPGMIADLKSTATESQRAFEAACEQFEYWRQMVLYCKMARLKKATIFGVSKGKHRVFVVTIKEGDERWNAGEARLNELAFKYFLLKA